MDIEFGQMTQAPIERIVARLIAHYNSFMALLDLIANSNKSYPELRLKGA